MGQDGTLHSAFPEDLQHKRRFAQCRGGKAGNSHIVQVGQLLQHVDVIGVT